METLTAPQTFPTPVSVTPSGTAWASSAWVQVVASTASAFLLTGVRLVPGVIEVEVEVDVGVGGAGAEVVLTTFRAGIPYTWGATTFWVPAPFPITGITAGQRVAVRLRKTGTNTTTWGITLGLSTVPSPSLLTATASPAVPIPSAAAGRSLTTSGANNQTAWDELSASLASAVAIVGLALYPATVAQTYEVELGTGGAGAEVVLTTAYAYCGGSTASGGAVFLPLVPAYALEAGTRLAWRLRGSAAVTARLAVLTQATPL